MHILTMIICFLFYVHQLEIDCGGLESPHHGDVMYTDTRYGSEAVYNCIPGYSLRFGDEIRTCINGGRWSGNEPCCIRKSHIQLTFNNLILCYFMCVR